MIPVSIDVKSATVDTQATSLQRGLGLVDSGLIRIKNGYIQKLGGCTALTTTLHGGLANFLLPWAPYIAGGSHPLIAIGTLIGLEVNEGSGPSQNITPAGYTGAGEWTLDLWGAPTAPNPNAPSLIAQYRDSTIFIWYPSLPINIATNAVAVGGTAPTKTRGLFVAAPQQQCFAWGIYDATSGQQDLLLVGWCDVGDLASWTATAINQAGSFRLSSGSIVVGGTWFGTNGFFWTDADLWTVQYVSFPLVYGFNRIAQNCGLISAQAWAKLGTLLVWMGQNDFYVYEGGSVRPIPCTVRDFVFNNLLRNGGTHLSIHADANSYGNEVTWRFSQTGDSGVCKAYVKWSPAENNAWDVWQYHVSSPPNSMWLTSWADESFLHPPLATDTHGNLLQFERSGNAVIIDYNGNPMNSFYKTGWFYPSEGQEEVFVERVMPDFIFSPTPGGTPTGQVQMTFYFADEIPATATDYPIRTYGPYVVTPETPFIIVRGSGRVMSYLVECTTAGTFYRAGKHLARISIAGRGR